MPYAAPADAPTRLDSARYPQQPQPEPQPGPRRAHVTALDASSPHPPRIPLLAFQAGPAYIFTYARTYMSFYGTRHSRLVVVARADVCLSIHCVQRTACSLIGPLAGAPRLSGERERELYYVGGAMGTAY
ncbi:hypothetical protein HETIRDRAFT_451379 [Heterobasidion irregulare TC 32-1]|uniref:Uncharacterized protein n=1 Tax=Heterobasidion irregulare (strain TC 32-1) TaxID=747525 RepID=W4K7A4_HETIT|nr:uncharacterized protein HETIRDRAFT_451379 [Heterobasidion irregulare TC 32-1]ETW81639.1 hypothetical protein HETIRDRAFT_451379 [Heterobasidion irregulare TC 32-1]